MNIPVRILEEALEETAEASAWYERERPGLGGDFLREVEAAFDLVEDGIFPLLNMPNKSDLKDVKRLILKKFPFDVVVLDRQREKIIIAVAHQSREPGYWRKRITQ